MASRFAPLAATQRSRIDYHPDVPTQFRIDGFRFFFFSNESGEPPHIHVEKGDGAAKWWLDPLEMAYSYGFSAQEQRKIRELVFAHRLEFKERWNEFFGR